MIRLIIALCVLLSVGVFASEGSTAVQMDTTYVVTAEGDTVGLVHRRGEYPIVPDELLGQPKVQTRVEPTSFQKNAGAQSMALERDDLTPVQKTAQKAVEAESRLNETYVDSIKYYQALVDHFVWRTPYWKT